jgi:hypothetical protein
MIKTDGKKSTLRRPENGGLPDGKGGFTNESEEAWVCCIPQKSCSNHALFFLFFFFCFFFCSPHPRLFDIATSLFNFSSTHFPPLFTIKTPNQNLIFTIYFISSGAPFALFIGIGILLLTSVISSSLGLVQELMTRKYGKHPSDNLFLSHFLALPLFFIAQGPISERFSAALASASLKEWAKSEAAGRFFPRFLAAIDSNSVIGGTWLAEWVMGCPSTVVLLVLTNATQYVCIRCVFGGFLAGILLFFLLLC